MAAPTLTYTLTNGSTADASQVMQNFNDLLNGYTDGTKDLTFSGLTVAGAASFQGAVTLGNGSVDDITITGSIAASIPIKTNNSFDFGSSTLGLAGVYLGAPSSRTTRITAHQSLSGSNTLVLPNGNGTTGFVLGTDGSGNMSWDPIRNSRGFSSNVAIVNATTTNTADSIKITGANGSALSSSNPGWVCVESSTAGQLALFKVTADVTINITGAHWGLGTFGDQTDYVLSVYAVNDAGTLKWGVSAIPNLSIVRDANDTATATSATQAASVLMNSAISGAADAYAVELGHFKANFDDTGGAAEDLWAVQTGVGDIRQCASLPVWKKYHPTFTGFGTVSTYEFFWRRVGDTVWVKGRFTAGTTTATEARVTYPTGLTSESSQKVHSTLEMSGKYNVNTSSASFFSTGSVIVEPSSTYMTFGVEASTANGLTKQNGNQVLSTGGVMSLFMSVPIANWDY